jgi:hypothetical protein
LVATAPKAGPRDFVSALSGLLLATVLSFALNWMASRSVERGLRVALSCASGGLIGYLYYAFQLPGTVQLYTRLPELGALPVTLLAAAIGLVIGWVTLPRDVERSH